MLVDKLIDVDGRKLGLESMGSLMEIDTPLILGPMHWSKQLVQSLMKMAKSLESQDHR